MPSLKKKLAMDILNNVYTILDKTKGLLEIASVPGLSAAADVVLAIIDQVKVHTCTPRLNLLTAHALVRLLQKMEANKDTATALSNKIEQLKDLIVNVVQNVERRAQSRGMEKSELWQNVQETDGWKNRVNQLQE